MGFWKSKQVELVSIHIPKTAGTSFRNLLKNVYGEKNVIRFDISLRGVVKLNEELYAPKELPPVTVIHGHFSYEALHSKFDVPDQCKYITWLRDPVQRVISNYLYLEKRLIEILNEEKNDLHILEKMQRTLVEYARFEINRNRQSKFLKGIDPTDFTFIGLTEHFEEDIKLLAEKLAWVRIPETLFHNVTASQTNNFSKEVLDEIRELNRDDIALYEHVLNLRNKNGF